MTPGATGYFTAAAEGSKSEFTMVEKCVNPECLALFRYLRKGRVFATEAEGDSRTEGKARPRKFHYIWLCDSCCRKMTVVVERGQGLKLVPLVAASMAAKAAS